jgi:hypothetical protein
VVANRRAAHGDEASNAAAPDTPTAPLPAFSALAVPEVPKIAGGANPAGDLPTPAAPPAPPAAPAGPTFDHAKVGLGAVHADKVASADVLAALPGSRFDRCYVRALTSKGSAFGGTGNLHLVIDSDGHVGTATFAGSGDLTGVGQCVAEAAVGSDIKHVEAGATAADVELSFRPE